MMLTWLNIMILTYVRWLEVCNVTSLNHVGLSVSVGDRDV
jgi:hypothetical protein